MQCFVASDDASTAREVCAMLVQLGHDCPASRVLRLDLIVPAVEASAHGLPGADADKSVPRTGGESALRPSGDGAAAFVIVVFPPDPERALSVVREIRRRTAVCILAVGPATETKLVLRALRDGASEYLDQADLKSELTGALQRLQTTTATGRILAVLAPSGGSGASTLAVNVATVLAQKHHGCLLLDLKLDAGDLAALLDLKPTYTIADLCQNSERLDYSLLQGCLAQHESGVQLLAAPACIADTARVTPEAIQRVLSLACRHFPFVLMDVDHSFRAEQRTAILQADVIVLVLRLDFISLRNTRHTLDYLQEIGVSRDRLRVVANRAGQPGELSVAQADESLGIKVSYSVPDDPKNVNRANNNGIPVVLQSPSARVARALTELTADLAKPPAIRA
jgi:pilus assembly protein CpaE